MENGNINDQSKRDFLKTAGKFAVYTPPALMIMNGASANDMYHSNNGCGIASNDVAAPGGSEDNNNAENAMGGQNCPETSQGNTF
ncbi:MAG: hypothetical protein P8X88_05295 [Gammaproteobacteria bacterium]